MTTTTSEYTLYPKVKPTGELPPKVLEHLDARYWNHDEEMPRGSAENALDVRDFGAVGDGVTDDTKAFTAAFEAGVGMEIFIPAGRYVISEPCRLYADTTLFGERGSVIVVPKRVSTSVFRASGYLSASAKHELATAVGVGDRVITTKTPHGFAPGDVVKLESQRIATSKDAGEWRIGWPTSGSTGPRFCEFVRILSVQSPTQFTLDTGLIFPGYRPDGSQETHESAGTSAVVMKSDGRGDRVTIHDLEFEGEAREFIRFVTCAEPKAYNLRFRIYGTESSKAVQFMDCYLGRADNVFVDNVEALLEESVHAWRNVFNITASQSTGITNSVVIRGTQCYDITYGGPQTVEQMSVYCYVENCTSLSATGNPITLHPGVYGCAIIGNKFTECLKSGIAIRSNSALVANNQVTGSLYGDPDEQKPGIYISEGAGKDSLITGNFVDNFHIGLSARDGGYKPYEGWVGLYAQGNVFRGFTVGAERTRMTQQGPVTSSQGLMLTGNLFVTDRVDAIGVLTCRYGRGVNGWSIKGNDFRMPRAGSTGVLIMGSSGDVAVQGNTFHTVGQAVTRDTTGLDSAAPTTVLHWSGNDVLSAAIDRFPPPTSDFQIESMDSRPVRLPDTDYSLNYAMYTARFHATPSTAGMARGWPTSGFEGYVDVTRLSNTLVLQTGYGTDGRRHTRTWASGTWTNWKVA